MKRLAWLAAPLLALALAACGTTAEPGGASPAADVHFSAPALPAVALVTPSTLAGQADFGADNPALNEDDRQYLTDTTQRALDSTPIGQRVNWSNPDTGHSGFVTPLKTVAAGVSGIGDTFCRVYRTTIVLGAGNTRAVEARACREIDGTWVAAAR